ncbi:hypothetical protein ST12_15145 [Clostridium botulinum]|nr:EpsG family protein [Clostridium botulinum]ACD53091.1 putative membrane protein [Clostridium botulinum E3 str. Alaska E43]AJF30987.1 hypothetical protein ST13_15145 [Clostridium botulinum]AJF34049.1 hypothetical protein ST12_15145 [Clostridium botulinum]MBY6790812.1 EpsG family protein [Clostridium botulinum]MBY6818373.1 EpsG family protein [Clostridium botulinum]
MAIYIINIISLFFIGGLLFKCSFNEVQINTRIAKKIVTVYFIVVFGLFLALRNKSVGPDTLLYCNIFKEIGNGWGISEYFNKFPGYALYNTVVAFWWGNSEQVIIFFNAIITISIIAIISYKISDNLVMTLFYYIGFSFYPATFNIARQSMSVALSLIMYYFLVKEKRIKALFIMLLAISIHNSAIVLVVIYILYIFRHKFNRKILVYGVGIGGILATCYEKIILFFIKIFPSYSGYIGENGVMVVEHSNGNRIIIAFILIMVIFYALLKLRGDNTDKEIIFMMIMTEIAIFMMFVFINNVIMFRLVDYFLIYIIYLIPNLLEKYEKRQFKIWIYLPSILIMGFSSCMAFSRLLPYKFFWQ